MHIDHPEWTRRADDWPLLNHAFKMNVMRNIVLAAIIEKSTLRTVDFMFRNVSG